jgi:NAD(P)-dependent dehydrogenase (short-subunit alcohol dehydrogenase family)
MPEPQLNSERFKGRVAAVTGASSGIGRAIALRLAREGARLACLDLREEPNDGSGPIAETIAAAGGGARFWQVDVTSPGEIEDALAAASSELGSLDVMVNNAGINIVEPSLEVSEEHWDRVLDVIAKGTFFGTQAALRQMLPAGYGRVVNIASNYALFGVREMAAYCAAKAAVVNLTRAFAVEYGHTGVVFNCLCPGATRTAINVDVRENRELYADWALRTPLRLDGGEEYFGEVEDVAAGVAFLASEENRFMTGSAVAMDGGWHAS